MKKILFLAIMGLFLFGCGTAAERSEFWSHPTMYRNWDHMGYSWGGYKNPTDKTGKQSKEQDWWGLPTADGKILMGHEAERLEGK